MPSYQPSPTNTFVRGLVTEAGELTFPQDASVDELNCDLQRDGSRRRRLAIAVEPDSVLSTETVTSSTIISTHTWDNVAEQSGVNFTVIQLGSELIFFEQTSSDTLSEGRVDTTFVSGVEYAVDLTSFESPTSAGAETAEVQVASIKGALVVVSPEINAFYITRDTTTGAFTETEIDFRVRDYAWQGDKTTYDEALTTGSTGDDRIYDTKNCGWSDGPNNVGDSALTTYTGGGDYPPLTHPWFSGKTTAGAFSVSEFNLIYPGSSLISNGHYILDLYSRDRETAAGLSSSTYNTTEDARFSTLETYAGRIFYSGLNGSTDSNGSKVFFTRQLIDGLSDIGNCHQINDPTSEDLSDLLDTDGGFILIPEANNIRELHTFGPDLYVFAENGVWKIGGVDDVFRATDYSVSKITEDGIEGVGSFLSAQGRPYWWSPNGIFTLQPNEAGSFTAIDISVSTIQEFFTNISDFAKNNVKADFDPINRRVFWFYQDTGSTTQNKRTRVLIFDEVLGAFFPWKIEDSLVGDYVVGPVFNRGTDTLKCLVVDGATGSTTFAEFSSNTFLDWGQVSFDSYAEAAYNFMGDMETRKSAPYVTVYLKTTEEGYVVNGDGYDIVRDSGCNVSVSWDFKHSFSVPQEAYRRKSVPNIDTMDLSDFGYSHTVVITRLKVRGRGRVMKLKFESQEGKDFHLLGYNVLGQLPGRF